MSILGDNINPKDLPGVIIKWAGEGASIAEMSERLGINQAAFEKWLKSYFDGRIKKTALPTGKQAAAQEYLKHIGKIAHIKPAFLDWLEQTSPYSSWRWGWQDYVRRKLEEQESGKIRHLGITLPPQHGKSTLTTVHYAVYRLACNPALRIAIGCYNQTFAAEFGREAKKLAETAGLELAPDSKAASAWKTMQGGGIISVGVGAGITGRPVDLLIIDDPIKNREEANSPVYRERVWSWYRDDLYTRLQSGSAIIMIMTRWHEDDLWGRIAASESANLWEFVRLPAIAEADDPLGRAEGEALCPERFTAGDLAEKRTTLGEYGFAALYQGLPRPREGGLFKADWLPIVNKAPDDIKSRVRYWDFAGSLEGDYTVGVLLSKTRSGVYYIEDVQRIRGTSFQVERLVAKTAERDGQEVKIYIEQEPGSGGLYQVNAYVRLLAGYSVRGDKPSGSKTTRADGLAAQAEAGNVRLVRGPWNNEYIDELCAFPTGVHDDQVDATSGAFNKLAGRMEFKAVERL